MGIDSTARDQDTPDDNHANTERTAQTKASTDDNRTRPRAETRTREEYADATRASGGPMSRDTSPDNREAVEEEPQEQPQRQPDHDRAEPRDRETYANDVRAAHAAGESPGPAAPVDEADPAAASVQDQGEAGRRPETMTFENNDIEVTHNAADGIWIEGLPGEPPTRIGDVLTSPEESERSRIGNFRDELSKDAEDLIDMGGKWTDLIRDAIGTPPPTNSMTHSRGPELTATQPDHGINAGHGAEALLTVAIVGAAAIHKLHERWENAWHH